MKQVKIFSTTSHCEELGKEMNDWITKQNNLINITDILSQSKYQVSFDYSYLSLTTINILNPFF